MKNNKFKNFILYLLKPPKYLIIVVYIITLLLIALSLGIVFTGILPFAVQLIIYSLAGIVLAYAVYIFVIHFSRIKQKIKNMLNSNKFTHKLINNFEYKILFFARVSFIINILYATFTAVIGVLEKSVWFGCLATYYIVLSVMRFLIVKNGVKLYKSDIDIEVKNQKKNKIYFYSGISMFVLDIAMIAPVTLMIISFKSANYLFDWFIFAIAAYTFYKFSISIYNIVKARKSKDRVIQAIRNINFTDALMSLLSLQVSLITAFGSNKDLLMIIFNAVMGFIVVVSAIVIGIIMIVRGNREKKRIKQNEK